MDLRAPTTHADVEDNPYARHIAALEDSEIPWLHAAPDLTLPVWRHCDSSERLQCCTMDGEPTLPVLAAAWRSRNALSQNVRCDRVSSEPWSQCSQELYGVPLPVP